MFTRNVLTIDTQIVLVDVQEISFDVVVDQGKSWLWLNTHSLWKVGAVLTFKIFKWALFCSSGWWPKRGADNCETTKYENTTKLANTPALVIYIYFTHPLFIYHQTQFVSTNQNQSGNRATKNTQIPRILVYHYATTEIAVWIIAMGLGLVYRNGHCLRCAHVLSK